MVLQTKTTPKGASRIKFPKGPDKPNVSKKDLEGKVMPELVDIKETNSTVLSRKLLQFSNQTLLIVSGYTTGVERIGIYEPIKWDEEGKPVEYKLQGLKLSYGDVDELLHGSVTKPGNPLEENGNMIAQSEIKKYRPLIKQLQALVSEYDSELAEYQLTQIREYK